MKILLWLWCYSGLLWSVDKYPNPIEEKKIDLSSPHSIQQMIQILEVYPKALKVMDLQKDMLDNQQAQLSLYKDIERKLTFEANKQKTMAIGLGIGIPVIVGLSIWAGIEIGKIFR